MTETLLDFTGRGQPDSVAFSNLESICTSLELWLSFCPIFSKEEWEKSISMACFSDFSLRESKNHSDTFSRFAIGFSKEKFIEYGANPVFYATPEHYQKIKSQFNLLERMEDLEKDREWRDEIEKYQFTEDETYSLQIVSGLLQEYAYRRDNSRLNYCQREWRISFNSLPFAGNGTMIQPGMSSIKVVDGKTIRYMKFELNDIEFIVGPKKFKKEIKRLSNEISKPFKIFEKIVAQQKHRDGWISRLCRQIHRSC